MCFDVENSCIGTTECVINSHDMKETINIAEKPLFLMGVIGFEEGIGDCTLRHYVAYCRSFDGRWFKYDDAAVQNRPVEVKKHFSTINAALVIFVHLGSE